MGNRDEPSRRYERAREKLDDDHESGELTDDEYSHITEFLDAKDPDVLNGHGDTLSYQTLRGYCRLLACAARRLPEDTTLTTATENDINGLISRFAKGNHPAVKDDGVSHATQRQYQATLRAFYNYHEELPADPDGITLKQIDDSPVDERDIFDHDDVEAMRETCSNTRDRAILELLLNTGQRIRAIQTLRVKDVNLDEGVFWLNDEADGLKHAEGKRPLLGAKAPVRRWLDNHPAPENPDAYLITHLPSYRNTDATTPLNQNSIRKRLRKIGNEAGVDKPTNPHNFRHFAVTTMYRDYDMDADTIRFIIGHGEDSRIMETTYRHLTDDDYIKKAEIAAEIREPDDDSPLSPNRCLTCDEPLAKDAKACPNCGHVYTPDAKAVQDTIGESMKESYKDTEPGSDTQAKVEQLDDLLDDPDVKAALLEKLADE